MQKNFDKSKIEKNSIFFRVIQFLFFILYHGKAEIFRNRTANTETTENTTEHIPMKKM